MSDHAESERARLIHNERIKMTAGWIDRASSTLFATGIATPVAGRLLGLGPSLSPGVYVAILAVFGAVAAMLHGLGRQLLGRLR
ncbi:MAG: hypothetical protein BGO51_26255 [Rhodospirillales bacterium 69-11]|nr:MAG: hypothetical protein BGO51_26255 [Rhodospirillales bacterium 69-11]